MKKNTTTTTPETAASLSDRLVALSARRAKAQTAVARTEAATKAAQRSLVEAVRDGSSDETDIRGKLELAEAAEGAARRDCTVLEAAEAELSVTVSERIAEEAKEASGVRIAALYADFETKRAELVRKISGVSLLAGTLKGILEDLAGEASTSGLRNPAYLESVEKSFDEAQRVAPKETWSNIHYEGRIEERPAPAITVTIATPRPRHLAAA